MLNVPESSAVIFEHGACGDNLAFTLDNHRVLTISGSGPMRDFYEEDIGFIETPWQDYRYMINHIRIQNGVTTIGFAAFYGCENLTSVTIPDSVTTIGLVAFYGCASLTSVTIPDSVTTIGFAAFCGCESLTSVTIPDSVKHIEQKAFHNCASLTDVSIPANANIEENAFPPNVRTERRAPPAGKIIRRGQCGANIFCTLDENGVLTISGSGPMRDCYWNEKKKTADAPWWNDRRMIIHIRIQNGVTTIGNWTFMGCVEAKSVAIPNSVTQIRFSAFAGCIKLTNVVIPDSVTEIGTGAFYGCEALTSVAISNSVRRILKAAFRNCPNLTGVSVPATANVEKDAFPSNIRVERRVLPVGRIIRSGQCGVNSRWTLDENGNMTISGSGSMSGFPPASNALSFENGCEIVMRVVIQNGVTKIEKSAFFGFLNLISVTIPDSVTEIGTSAFFCCFGLTSVDIPDSVTVIESGAFENCSSLTSVTIPDSVTKIESSIFAGCKSLTSVTIPDSVTVIAWKAFEGCAALKSVTIPDSVTTIEASAFAGCKNLTSVTIPDSVTEIGTNAFKGCQRLTSVSVPAHTKISTGLFKRTFPPNVRVERRA